MLSKFPVTGKKATRDGFGDGLLVAGQQNDQVVALCADLVGSLKMNAFIKSFPEGFFQYATFTFSRKRFTNSSSVYSGYEAMTSSACFPMDPVEPKMAIFFFKIQGSVVTSISFFSEQRRCLS